ncbi:unnamed protein product [Euphydryas editha]|uniref:Uncharacterized protein n=1 Tax=Euphydryas editha TaxID=104508 RepID=A0AAU9T9A2_EUPED|nr:unnamed protein product [Euphydryas editha]
MVFTTCLYIFALVCAGWCNPLIPAGSSTTVCDTTPNMLGLGLNLGALGPLGLNLLPYPHGLPINPVQGSTTVCESTNIGVPASLPINLAEWQANLLNYYSLPIPTPNVQVPSTTVCESTPNVYGVPNLPFIGGLPYMPRPFGPYGPMIGGVPAIV